MTPNYCRDGVGQIRRKILQRGVDDAPKPSGGQTALSSGLIDGHDATDFERCHQLLFRGIGAAVFSSFSNDLELRLGELEFAAAVVLLNLAVQGDDLAGLELVPQISGVEPDTLQPRPPLPGGHLKDGHSAGTEEAGGPHFSNHGSHFSSPQFRNTPRVEPVFVAKRQVVQQVVESLNVLGRQELGKFRANALHVLNGGVRLQHLMRC